MTISAALVIIYSVFSFISFDSYILGSVEKNDEILIDIAEAIILVEDRTGTIPKQNTLFVCKKRGYFNPIRRGIHASNQYIFLHELGHAIDYEYEITNSKKFRNLYKNCNNFPTEYSKQNIEEFFAECFAFYILEYELSEEILNYFKTIKYENVR